MRKAIITTIITGLIGFGGIAAPMAAFAAGTPPVDTTTTLEIQGGDLTLTAQPSANLGAVTAGVGTKSGHLGDVTVADARAALGGDWTASATSTDFVTGIALGRVADQKLLATAVEYGSGEATDSAGVATFGPGTKTALGGETAVTAFTASAEDGVTSVTWDPTAYFTLRDALVVGSYTGTITHSVALPDRPRGAALTRHPGA